MSEPLADAEPSLRAAPGLRRGRQARGDERAIGRAVSYTPVSRYISPRLFPMMVGYPAKFPIMDFYLQNCGKVPICGFVKDNLLLMDVGKLDTLDDAQAFVRRLDDHI